jgi:hypothetical protein
MMDCIAASRRRLYGGGGGGGGGLVYVYEHLWMSVMGGVAAMPLRLGANAVFTPPTPK